MAADKSKEDVELDEMEDEEEAGEGGPISKRTLPGSINAYQNFLEMMQVIIVIIIIQMHPFNLILIFF